ncbi:MAG TPA: alpha/beta fold hydrolase, partial [Thermoanaerobaculia bacterium]|nr:alpha/beta fold hydrolase [Thermoanaerobaculia bacterium]
MHRSLAEAATVSAEDAKLPQAVNEKLPARRSMRIARPFRFRRGGEIPEMTLAYETWGELSASKDNALLLTTGLSPGSHARSTPENPAAGWWEEMIGPGRPIDTDRWFVVCNNSLGSCHGSTGPASIDPRTGDPYRLAFPELSVEDIASSSRDLLKELGVDRLGAVVGPSLGGMTALAYALLHPDEIERLVMISAASAASPFAMALRSIQREAIRSDPDWKGGGYAPGRGPKRGMGLARKLGVVTY